MIKIISFVDSFKHFDGVLNEYLKRLGRDVELVKLKPQKNKNTNEIIKKESEILNNVLEKEKGFKILLYIDAQILSTKEFLNLIEKNEQNYSNIIFIIGGAYGIDYEIVKNNINMTLSLSRMTFTHIQAITILIEQIYRIKCIKKGVKYHH